MDFSQAPQSCISLLKSTPIFSQLDEESELPQLNKITSVQVFKAGEKLIEQGQPSRKIVVILSGEVRVFINNIVIDSLGLRAGNAVGEVSFFTKNPYSATAIATQETRGLVISFDDLNNLMSKNTEISLKIRDGFVLEILDKLKRANNQIISLALQDPLRQVAHDIRSPISALKALLFNYPALDLKDTELLSLAVARIDRIVQSILEKRSDSHPLSLQEIAITEVVSILENLIREKKAHIPEHSKIHFDLLYSDLIAKGPKLFIQVNLAQLERVISNLVDNSIQAISEAGRIRFSLLSHENYLQLEIQDTGIGIPPEVLPLLGQTQFSQGKPNGSGLGLYHAAQQIRSWGGKIDLISEPNHGTLVRISLPCWQSLEHPSAHIPQSK